MFLCLYFHTRIPIKNTIFLSILVNNAMFCFCVFCMHQDSHNKKCNFSFIYFSEQHNGFLRLLCVLYVLDVFGRVGIARSK